VRRTPLVDIDLAPPIAVSQCNYQTGPSCLGMIQKTTLDPVAKHFVYKKDLKQSKIAHNTLLQCQMLAAVVGVVAL